MKTFLKKLLFKIKVLLKFVWKKYPEVFTLPFSIWLFYNVRNYIYNSDPLASRLDTSAFLIPIFTVLILLFFLSVVWIIMGLLFSTARRFLAKELKDKFTELTSWQKIKYSTAIFFGLLFSLALLSFIIA